MPDTTPAATPAALPDHVPPPARRCRALTVKGLQCHSRAIRGHNYCFTHKHFGFPVCPDKGPKVAIPLLEDLATVQVFLTQIAQGLLSGRLSPVEARSLSYTCQVASGTFARPVAARPKKAAEDLPVLEPILNPAVSIDGHPIGPDEKYCGPEGKPESRWFFGKIAYQEECERNGWPVPEDFADFPAQGWLTSQEQWATKGNPQALEALFKAKLALAREQAIAREAEESRQAIATGLPDPHAGKIHHCPTNGYRCQGPGTFNCCDACRAKKPPLAPPPSAADLDPAPLRSA
jgi:hypothetical protein